MTKWASICHVLSFLHFKSISNSYKVIEMSNIQHLEMSTSKRKSSPNCLLSNDKVELRKNS